MTESTTRYTLVFDGDCGFCSSVSRTIEKRSARTERPIVAVPWQWAKLADFGLTEQQAAAQVWLVEGEPGSNKQTRFGGHECFAKLAELHGTAASKLLARVMLTPAVAPISALGYRLVARYRHLLPGGTPACKLPRT